MHETGGGKREIDRLLLEMREDVEQARWLLEGQAAQEQIIDQSKDGGVQPDPERQGNEREESEPRGFEQLPERETKISHHRRTGFSLLFLVDAPSGAIGFNKETPLRF